MGHVIMASQGQAGCPTPIQGLAYELHCPGDEPHPTPALRAGMTRLDHAGHDVIEPPGALTAGRALAA
jgi:hypothetical protein